MTDFISEMSKIEQEAIDESICMLERMSSNIAEYMSKEDRAITRAAIFAKVAAMRIIACGSKNNQDIIISCLTMVGFGQMFGRKGE